MKIAIFLPNWIGDVVMATPTLRAVRQHFGGPSEIVGVMRPYVADVLAGTNWLDDHIYYDPKSSDRGLRMKSLIRQLRKLEPDIVLLLTNSLRTGLLARLSGAARRVGYVRYGRGWLLTDKLVFPRSGRRYLPVSALDSYLRLTDLLGCGTQSSQTELATRAEDEEAAEHVWRKFDLPPGREVVVLNSGAAYGAAKSWPDDYFAALARRIAEDESRDVLVICGPAERDAAADIVRRAGHARVHSLADEQLSIGLSKACVRRSRLMVSTDSGPRHFAAAFDVPVITLYGPTHIAWGDTHYPGEIHLQEEVPCGPCMRRACPLGHHRCMRDLSVERVYAAVATQLSNSVRAPAA